MRRILKLTSQSETLHQKLQARRLNTPYHEFKKGDIVGIIKGRAKGREIGAIIKEITAC